MRRLAQLSLLTVVSALAIPACAPKTSPPPVISMPRFPDFVAPGVPASLASGPAAGYQTRGWRLLEEGDVRSAEHEFSTALKTTPAFYPAEAALGYVELARKDGKAALPHFDRALDQQKDDVSALVGRGYALIALGRERDAAAAFEAAVAADPSLVDLKRRVAVLQFRGLEQDLARARQATHAGKLDEAIAAYMNAIASSPDSAVLYRELAAVERQKGDLDPAIEHLRRAVALDPTDSKSLVQMGELFDANGDVAGAEKAYSDALALEPAEAADLESKIEMLRERAELARLPEEYRAIEEAPEITRGDLAALIGVRLAPLLQASRRRDVVLITDVRAHWAAIWIMSVARAGVMDPFSNHAFQPRTPVRRADLAQAASRLLARISAANPSRASSWESARLKFSDLLPGHLAYPAASAAVAAGVMTMESNGAFEPSKPVSGADAIAAIGRIEALAGPLATGKGNPPK
jgi:tetratricopeptide (TPR) repeat protein